jgi:hypothetical protein
MLPVQGVFVQAAEWERWSGASNPAGASGAEFYGDPYREIWQSIRKKQTKLVPANPGLVWLSRAKAWLGI